MASQSILTRNVNDVCSQADIDSESKSAHREDTVTASPGATRDGETIGRVNFSSWENYVVAGNAAGGGGGFYSKPDAAHVQSTCTLPKSAVGVAGDGNTPNVVATKLGDGLTPKVEIKQAVYRREFNAPAQDFGPSPTVGVRRVSDEKRDNSGTNNRAGRAHRGQPVRRRYERRRRNANKVVGQLEEQISEARGEADALRECKKDANEKPSQDMKCETKAVDFAYTSFPEETFVASSVRLGTLQSRLYGLDGSLSEFAWEHVWRKVGPVAMDMPLDVDQRSVTHMSYDMYKKDPQLVKYTVGRAQRWSRRAEEVLVDGGHRTTASSTSEAIVSWTMAANIIGVDGPGMFVFCDHKFLEGRWDRAVVGVNVPGGMIKVKTDTLTFIRDYCDYVCRKNQWHPDSDTPCFPGAPLIAQNTRSLMDTAEAKAEWGISNLLGPMLSCAEVTKVLKLIFLVYLWDAILTGPRAPVRTLMISERWSAACANVLVAPGRKLKGLYSSVLGVLLGSFCDVIWYLCRTRLGLMLLIGCLAQTIPSGVANRSTINSFVTTGFFYLVTLPAVVSLSVKLITMLVRPIKKLEPSTPVATFLKPIVDQFLVQLNVLCIILAPSLSTFRLLNVLHMSWTRCISLAPDISPLTTPLLRRISTLTLLDAVKVSCTVICYVMWLMGAPSLKPLSNLLRVVTPFGLVVWWLQWLVVACRVICVHLWGMVLLISCSCFSAVIAAAESVLGL